jgi:hypothetical protein
MPAAIPIVAAVGGALIANAGSKKAANIQAEASDRAGAISDRQYNQTRTDQLAQLAQTRADQAPYREAALPSIATLSRGLQPGGEYARSFSMDDYQADPGYQFRLKEGQKSIQAAAASRGGAYSGATLKALARFNSDQASQEYGSAYSRFNTDKTTQFNRNATMAGYGQTANSAVGNAGTSAYGTIAQAGQANSYLQGQALQNAGEARASGYVGAANNIGAGIKSIYDNYQQSQFTPNTEGSGRNPYQNYDAAINGGWGIE